VPWVEIVLYVLRMSLKDTSSNSLVDVQPPCLISMLLSGQVELEIALSTPPGWWSVLPAQFPQTIMY
jgi:hypothetical protein